MRSQSEVASKTREFQQSSIDPKTDKRNKRLRQQVYIANKQKFNDFTRQSISACNEERHDPLCRINSQLVHKIIIDLAVVSILFILIRRGYLGLPWHIIFRLGSLSSDALCCWSPRDTRLCSKPLTFLRDRLLYSSRWAAAARSVPMLDRPCTYT